MDRLLSAYLSKFEGREDNKGQRFKDTYEHYKSEIIDKIRKGNKNGSTGTQITFEEFLKFTVLDNQSANDQVSTLKQVISSLNISYKNKVY